MVLSGVALIGQFIRWLNSKNIILTLVEELSILNIGKPFIRINFQSIKSHGRHSMLAFLRFLPILGLRILDIEINNSTIFLISYLTQLY